MTLELRIRKLFPGRHDAAPFYPAEGYHQDYFENNPRQPYCQVVVEPKVRKFREKFAARMKGGVTGSARS